MWLNFYIKFYFIDLQMTYEDKQRQSNCLLIHEEVAQRGACLVEGKDILLVQDNSRPCVTLKT